MKKRVLCLNLFLLLVLGLLFGFLFISCGGTDEYDDYYDNDAVYSDEEAYSDEEVYSDEEAYSDDCYEEENNNYSDVDIDEQIGKLKGNQTNALMSDSKPVTPLVELPML